MVSVGINAIPPIAMLTKITIAKLTRNTHFIENPPNYFLQPQTPLCLVAMVRGRKALAAFLFKVARGHGRTRLGWMWPHTDGA
jgi:hypothetical protein